MSKKKPILYLLKLQQDFVYLDEERLNNLNSNQIIDLAQSSYQELHIQMQSSIKKTSKKTEQIIKDLTKGMEKFNSIYPGVIVSMSKLYTNTPQA